jgi:hypothetical protein
MIEAVICARGNGLPTVGAYVPGNGQLYRVMRLVGQIQTGRYPGEGDWIRAEVEEADWADCEEADEFPAHCEAADEVAS